MTGHTLPTRSETIGWLLAAVLSFVLVTAAWPAAAQKAEPVLREQIEVFADVVTLGDLFENAGLEAGTAVFRAPDLGTEGVVAGKRVAAAARQHGLIWQNRGGIDRIIVRRPSRSVSPEEITNLIRTRLAHERGLEDGSAIDIQFSQRPRPITLDPRIKSPPTIRRFHLDERAGTFSAVIGIDSSLQRVKERIYQGRAYEAVSVAVPARNVARGATIVAEDLRTVRMAKRRVPAGIVADIGAIAGMAAKRQLTAGRLVRQSDIERPKLVRRNTLVTIIMRGPGLLLKAQGRAATDGAAGETVAVLNTRSQRTIQARVEGPGLVSVISASAAAAVATAHGSTPADRIVTSAAPQRSQTAPRAARGSHSP